MDPLNKRKKKIKKFLWPTLLILILGGGILIGVRFMAQKPTLPESKILSRNGLHWHPHLTIKILNENIEIPAGIGLGITEQYIHTHETDGIVHIEFPGLVRESDLRLWRFFEIWGKKFNKDCIFENCNNSERKLKMLVNGKENFEFENYIMRNGDKIEIIFE